MAIQPSTAQQVSNFAMIPSQKPTQLGITLKQISIYSTEPNTPRPLGKASPPLKRNPVAPPRATGSAYWPSKSVEVR